ncbi:MAG TPA: hypothetical protein V6D17_14865 [Candidatus Obscuribacterales bacterium]
MHKQLFSWVVLVVVAGSSVPLPAAAAAVEPTSGSEQNILERGRTSIKVRVSSSKTEGVVGVEKESPVVTQSSGGSGVAGDSLPAALSPENIEDATSRSIEKTSIQPADTAENNTAGGRATQLDKPSGAGAQPISSVRSGAEGKVDKAQMAQPAFPIAGKLSRTIQTITGLNLLTGMIASYTAGAILKKKFGGKVRVSIKTFSLTDLLAGKVKSVSCKLAGSSIRGVRLGEVQAATKQPIWLDFRNKRHIQLKSPVLVSVKAALNQKDVTQALQSPQVASTLRGLNVDLPGLGSQQLQVLKPKVEFEKDVVKIEAILVTEGASEATGVPVVISGRLKLSNDTLLLEDLKVTGDGIVEPEKFAAFAEKLLNPIVDFRKLDRRDHAFRLARIDFGSEGVSGEGSLILAPRAGASQLAQNGRHK